MEYSMYKTFGRKYKINARKIIHKYHVNGNFTVFHTNKKGVQKSTILYNNGFKRKLQTVSSSVDELPKIGYTLARTSLIDRLKANKCELCEATEELQMHHLRKMSDIKGGKEPWQIRMIARRRKTMAVCKPCHRRIDNGK